MRAALPIVLACMAFGQNQKIERWELRTAADGLRLYITIEGEDRLISNRAVKAWQGWTPQVIVYAERDIAGAATQRLRWYDAFTRDSFTISTGEELEYMEVIPVRMGSGDYVLLISLRDPQTKAPWCELASPRGGVFLREQYAAWGTAANDRVQLRRYLPQDIERAKGNIGMLSPDVIATVPLTPPAKFEAAGLYEYSDAGRTVTLNLRPGGQGTLVVQQEGKGQPAARQGTWTQAGNEVGFEGMSWVTGVNGLTPKRWNREEWGTRGLPLRRAGAAAAAAGSAKR